MSESLPALDPGSFAAMVDHTILSPTATEAEVRRVCAQALEFGTAAVCVNPLWVAAVAEELQGSDVAVCSVAGFPSGAEPAQAVAGTARIAADHGATEVDIVIPLGLVLDARWDRTAAFLATVRQAVPGVVLKVILETAVLDDRQIVQACEVAVTAGADFVKTSTGFHAAGGATVDAVRLMRTTVGPGIGVKASGGIRSLADVRAMIAAGASRLGMSATASVIAELN